ncbi:M23 family metallopeptidase [Asanoa sp. WMMD1127]|uniref:peptidoglycan DD-metalloendopeptidase family protein n=1 Tax=Asanoa sp. WMMD1127 TaxID=3016107 RepID=UPI002417EBDB|nr:M23 family metallopeptidase [Asanoa sp. WMMD1127]MDG4820883.1 M23 family metallopeptidase [Asanoa sp. WMMD1127]
MLVLAVVVLAAIQPAGAARGDPRDDKKRIDAEVARASSILEGATERAQEAARQLVAATGKMPAAEQLVIESKGQVVAAQVRAETAQRKADVAQAAVASAQKRFAAADRDRREGQQQIVELAAAAYKGSTIANINVLIRADNPTDALYRFGYVDRVISDQRRMVRSYLDAVAVARHEENDATVARAAADEAMLTADTAVDEASVAEDQAEDAVREVAQLVRQKEEALTVAQEERAASLQKYKEAKAESAKIAAALRAWEAKQQAAAEAKLSAGRLFMPVHGEKSSDFGNRFDPYYHVWQLHAGMDIAAGGGTPIHAAAAGKVIMAGWNGGYGNYTCLSHGKYRGRSMSTCYGHQSKILVHEGQEVKRGEVIGRVGTTGASTGDHLHFEVRLNGDPVQPLDFLAPCLC